jgi:hypothetical protein
MKLMFLLLPSSSPLHGGDLLRGVVLREDR